MGWRDDLWDFAKSFLVDLLLPLLVGLAGLAAAAGAVVGVAALVVWLVVGPVVGTVTEKNFIAAHDEHSIICAKTCFPSTTHIPDRWWLRVRNCDKHDRCKDAWQDVPEPVFYKYALGDNFNSERIK